MNVHQPCCMKCFSECSTKSFPTHFTLLVNLKRSLKVRLPLSSMLLSYKKVGGVGSSQHHPSAARWQKTGTPRTGQVLLRLEMRSPFEFMVMALKGARITCPKRIGVLQFRGPNEEQSSSSSLSTLNVCARKYHQCRESRPPSISRRWNILEKG